MYVCVCVCVRVMLWAALPLFLWGCSGGWWEHKFWYLGNWVLIMLINGMEWESNVRGEDRTKSLSHFLLVRDLISGENGCCCVVLSFARGVIIRVWNTKSQKLPNFSKNRFKFVPNHKLIYISPSLILYLVIFFFLRNVFGNTCYTQIVQIKISVAFFLIIW